MPETETADDTRVRARRFAGRALLIGLAFATMVVLVAQFDPGRFVYVQPLRGAVTLGVFGAVVAIVLAAAVWLLWQGRTWTQPLVTCLVIGAMFVAPAAYGAPDFFRHNEIEHEVSVVATSPDRTYEVVSAYRYGGSGRYQILRVRTRQGLFSRISAYELAVICDRLVQVRFVGPFELSVVTRSPDYPWQREEQREDRIRIDPRVYSTADYLDTCAGVGI